MLLTSRQRFARDWGGNGRRYHRKGLGGRGSIRCRDYAIGLREERGGFQKIGKST